MKKITRLQLIELLTAIKGATFATITLSTEPSNMRKTNNPFAGLVRKVAQHMVCLNYIYENAVNNQREREEKFDDAPFVAQETWGTHITPSLIENNGQMYLQCKIQKSLGETFVNTLDGTVIDKAELAPFLREKAPNLNQGIDKEVINIRPKVNNIIAINIKGEQYEVVN